MAYEIINTLRNKSLIRVVGADTVSLTLNNFSTNTSTEVVSSVKITQVKWSTNNNIVVTRNTTPLLSLYESGDWNLMAAGMILANSATSNVNITITGDGTCILECAKEATYTPKLG